MPVISMFYGIIIYMNWNDHMPPHFHAKYHEFRGIFTLTGELLEGNIPARQMRQIKVWAELHYDELEADWEVSRQDEPLYRIDPLK
ncbi:MAG: DUF4160 domain-containing protein [Synergistaceae bacterium]|nr:DUF4160 domain-containing protein [Synergistaceae bacterium]